MARLMRLKNKQDSGSLVCSTLCLSVCTELCALVSPERAQSTKRDGRRWIAHKPLGTATATATATACLLLLLAPATLATISQGGGLAESLGAQLRPSLQ